MPVVRGLLDLAGEAGPILEKYRALVHGRDYRLRPHSAVRRFFFERLRHPPTGFKVKGLDPTKRTFIEFFNEADRLMKGEFILAAFDRPMPDAVRLRQGLLGRPPRGPRDQAAQRGQQRQREPREAELGDRAEEPAGGRRAQRLAETCCRSQPAAAAKGSALRGR